MPRLAKVPGEAAPTPRPIALCAALWLLLGGGLPASSAAETSPAVRWEFGWQGQVVVGRWTAAAATVTLDRPASVRVDVSVIDPEGHPALFRGAAHSLEAGERRVTAFFKPGRIDAVWEARLVVDEQVVERTRWRPGSDEAHPPLLKLSDQLIVSVGRSAAMDALATPAGQRGPAVRWIALAQASELPAQARAYEPLRWLVLTGATPLSPETSAAVRDWVAGGGRLVVSAPKDAAAFQSSPLKDWLPVTIGPETFVARDLGSLEAFAGRNVRIPITGRLALPKLAAAHGQSLATSRDDPLLVRAPYGLGEVHVVALDLTQPPLSNWLASQDFARKLLQLPAPVAAGAPAPSAVGAQLTSTGVSDLASQLQACQDQFAGVARPSPWWSMVWLLVYLAVVGPLDYLLVHRVLRRPQLTWLTLPLLVVAGGVLVARAAQARNTAAAQLNQVELVDLDVDSGTLRARSWFNYYSPDTALRDFAVQPQAPWTSDAPAAQQLTWSAAPENAFGGLYRPGGVEWGRVEYALPNNRLRAERLPLLKWSSRSLVAEWRGQAPPVIDADLRGSGLGRLSGKLTHRLPTALTDWVVAYGSRLYRLQPGRDDETSLPLAPGVEFNLENPSVYQRELRAALTRTVALKEQRAVDKKDEVRMTQTRYDPLHLDTGLLLEVLTFHTAAGGAEYTTLTNELLGDDDLSRQLTLGRAVILGRLDAPAAEVAVDGRPVAAQRRDTCVRIVLPVRRSLDIERTLPILKPETAAQP